MLQHVSFSPNLYTTAWKFYQFYVMISVTFGWMRYKLAFPPAGWRNWGWVYKKKLSKWIPNGYENFPFLPNLYTTTLTVLRNDLRDLRKWVKDMQTGLFLLQADVAGDGSTTNNIKLIPNGFGLKLTLSKLTFNLFDLYLRWMNKSSISNREVVNSCTLNNTTKQLEHHLADIA
jgi:hypothetical protein